MGKSLHFNEDSQDNLQACPETHMPADSRFCQWDTWHDQSILPSFLVLHFNTIIINFA